MDRITRLSEANELLHQLHRVAQTLPASLDLTEVVTSTVLRLHELLHPDVIAVLLPEGPNAWTVATVKGMRLTGPLSTPDLPAAMRRAIAAQRPQLVDQPVAAARGLGAGSLAAIYLPLVARGSLVGVIAVESCIEGRFGGRHVDLLEALAEPVGLAIDNARWFARLRTVGADEERTRIARDLHDRLGQSLAYLAFELDRISAGAAGHPLHDDVVALREDVRRVVSEVRSTLSDLRTDVSEDQDVVVTLDAFVRRVGERTGLRVAVRAAADQRLPLPQERELWRVAQEAITNVERHAHAASLTVTWKCDEMGAYLRVADDGIGFRGQARPDAYGLLGMRERADAVGATLTVTSAPGRGTVVECQLARSDR
jgi:signal transduction histidine kinase